MYWHWSERLADQVLSRSPPYVITSGVTPSGPVHLGTLCEFLFPEAIYRTLKSKGVEAEFYFIMDDLDALDSVNLELAKYKDFIEAEMGKPLSIAKDPEYPSYAERYIKEIEYIVNLFGASPKIIRVSELYKKGLFTPYAKLYMNNIEKVKDIVEKTSGRTLTDWTPIMPICENCKRIDSTKVISWNDSYYEYICKCSYTGKDEYKNYKLQWRLHWPTWQAIFNTTIEGGGVDHFTKGGSRDTAIEIHKQILNREPPIGYKYGFVLIEGKKYSKSKGFGMYVKDMVKILPPPMIAYHLAKYDLEENIDFNPTKDKLLNIIADYEDAQKLQGELSRADRKRYIAFKLFGIPYKASLRDMLLYYTIYKDWNKVKVHIEIDERLIQYIDYWIKYDMVPDDYNFSYNPRPLNKYLDLIDSLNSSMQPIDIHNFIYEYAKSNNIDPKELFKFLYNHLINKDKGPRLGKLIYAIGVERVKKDLKPHSIA